jgi:hypothetical protein
MLKSTSVKQEVYPRDRLARLDLPPNGINKHGLLKAHDAIVLILNF